MAEGGWLGVSFPEEYGGADLGIASASVMMRAIAKSSGAMQAASAIHMNVFGPKAVAVFGNEEQKLRWLPPIIKGEQKSAFGVTEPNAGLDTGSITTRADSASNSTWAMRGPSPTSRWPCRRRRAIRANLSPTGALSCGWTSVG
ncbi:MAG: acyl-CoA dehydrogenase family protein [Planctomycetota bacterium]